MPFPTTESAPSKPVPLPPPSYPLFGCLSLGGHWGRLTLGSCPHAAIREDISANLHVLEDLQRLFKTEILLIESGGDNLAANYSRELADYIIYVVTTHSPLSCALGTGSSTVSVPPFPPSCSPVEALVTHLDRCLGGR